MEKFHQKAAVQSHWQMRFAAHAPIAHLQKRIDLEVVKAQRVLQKALHEHLSMYVGILEQQYRFLKGIDSSTGKRG